MLDFHIHTQNSDGELNDEEIVEKASKLYMYAITDHDNIDFHLHCRPSNCLIGVELKTVYDGEPIELLAYNFDTAEFAKNYIFNREKQGQMQDVLLEQLIPKFADVGCIINKNISNEGNDHAHLSLYCELIKHKENETILGDLLQNRSSFYRKVSRRDSIFYISEESSVPSIKYIADFIHELGGKVFVAHCNLYHHPERVIEGCKKTVDGIECFHQNHSAVFADKLVDYCEDNNLLISGGTDYHRGNGELGAITMDTLDRHKRLFNWILG